MLKILTAAQIRNLDKVTIESEPIASIDLMERASIAFVRWFVKKFNYSQRVGIVCGTGNNGGDGLAIARLLKLRRYDVTVWIIKGGGAETPDFIVNLQRLAGIVPVEINQKPTESMLIGVDVVVDAMFGSGLSRPLEGLYSDVVSVMNGSSASKVAVDIPSGLMADKHSVGEIFNAQFTISFQIPKLALFLPENEKYVGQWELVNIGLSQSEIDNTETHNLLVNGEWVRAQVEPRSKFAHKGDFGKALVVAGSYGKMGACVLAARATLRTGAGLVTVHTPACGYTIVQSSVPEAMVSVDEVEQHVSGLVNSEHYDCIGVGPGLGMHKDSSKAIKQALQSGKPVVIDADALNLLAESSSLKNLLHKDVILTPHPGEFRRLVGEWSDDFERLDLQRNLSVETGATVVVKGAHTSVATSNGDIFFNSTGNPGMATGGSGDVLTGILTGLLAQGIEPPIAAILGVYLHGRAGDLAFAKSGRAPLIASDIIDMIPAAFSSSFL
jgi:hydroxyethylthiazole kinase-like uncharacterized protein yjeF